MPSPLCSVWQCILLFLILPAQSPAFSNSQPRTLQSFGVEVRNGQPIYPLPSNVALGLLNTDPLLDVAYYARDKLQVYQNLGDGTFELVWEKRSRMVEKMEWWKTRMLSEGIPDVNSWGDLHVSFTDGSEEVISHEEIVPSPQFLRFTPTTPMSPQLDFREVWRSVGQSQPVNRLAIEDVDRDGRLEMVYFFVPQLGDSNRLVVYKSAGNDSFIVDWDTLITRAFGPYVISDFDNDGNKEIILTKNGQIVILECYGPRQYKYFTTNISYSAPPFRVLETDIDHNGTKELCLLTSTSSPQPSTTIYIAEFVSKSQTSFQFNVSTAQYYGYTFDMAVGQIDGEGRDEILLAGGTFGAYLWHNGSSWIPRYIQTGLQIGVTAPMFVSLDSDASQELFIGGIGPIGHGSCYALDYVGDTTWRVLWVDSTLRNTPLSVNAGLLAGEFVVAGANTWDRSPLDTLYTELHVYGPLGNALGIWQRDTASVQNFHFLDIDGDGRTNLVAPVISHLIPDHLAVYEYHGTADVGEDRKEMANRFKLSQNYPNPFNATTRITYTITASGMTTLKVFDLLGREVATLVNEVKQPGSYSIDLDGSRLSSGVYFYRIEQPGGFAVKKLVLLR